MVCWTPVLKHQISQNKADASKNALLERVNSKAVEHKDKNFSSDWNGGNTLCELVSKLEPDFNMNEANGKPAVDQRIEYAENIAEEKMNIPPIIDPKDMAMDEPDAFSVMRTSRSSATTRRRGWRRTVRRCTDRGGWRGGSC